MSLGLAQRGIVAFADVGWSGTWYSRHQILSRLARRFPVVIAAQPVPIRAAAGELARRRALEPVPAISGRLWSYRAPAWLPHVYRPAIVGHALSRLQGLHLRTSVRSLGMRDPIAYVWNPDFADQVEAFGAPTVVYHCYDKYNAYQGAPVEVVDAAEGRIVRAAKLVIASSRILAADLSERFSVESVQLPHGVDFEWFDSLATNSPEPADLAAIRGPRIGYIARLDERFDTESLSAIARARPDWSLVIIGDAAFQHAESRARFEAFAALPNVHALGGRPRESIPAYTKGLDVCLLCYKTENWGRFVQPIKAYEYLAIGKPIVSTRIEAVLDFGGLVRVADSPQGWVEQIGAALEERGPEWQERRRDFARANTWDRRVDELVALFEARLG